MKWKSTYKGPPSHGDTREVPRFLIIPTWIDGYWHWLETVYLIQEYEGENWADDGWHTVDIKIK